RSAPESAVPAGHLLAHHARAGGAPGMAETLLQFRKPVLGSDGSVYEARACGGPRDDGMWEGWVEFLPIDGGAPARTGRETTQPNRVDTEYWATGLSQVYLEGALGRALDAPITHLTSPQPSVFPMRTPRNDRPVQSVLDPFSVYEKGESLLRTQLGALSAW